MNAPPRFLSVEEVLELHEQLVRRFGGSHGVRDLGIGVCEGTVTKKALAGAFRDNAAPFEE